MKWIAPICAFLLSCGGEQATPESPESAVQPASAEEAAEPVAPEPAPSVPLPEEGVPEVDACVTDCVQSRQMQATSIEQITHDCEKSCASATE